MPYSQKELAGLEEYYQRELELEVYADYTAPGLVTLVAICAEQHCFGLVAKATASTKGITLVAGHELAFRSLVRQVGEQFRCIRCVSMSGPVVSAQPVRRAGHSGRTSRKCCPSQGRG